jgi:DNA-binding MurR/RpiR family transcriptional regulator
MRTGLWRRFGWRLAVRLGRGNYVGSRVEERTRRFRFSLRKWQLPSILIVEMVGTHRRAFIRDLAVQVSDKRSRLSNNDGRIVEYLRERPDELAFHTSKSLAVEVGVSQAAVIRLACKLGYGGFTELREAARQELRDGRPTLAARFSERGELSTEDVFRQDVDNLIATRSFVDAELPRAASIAGASAVYVVGDRETLGLAVFLHRRLHIVLQNVNIIDPSFPDNITRVGPKDAVVVCVFPRYSWLSADLLKRAKSSGARTVVVTDTASRDFLTGTDHVLVAATESAHFHWSMVAPVAVLEGLVAEVAAVSPEETRRRLETTDQFKREQGFFLDRVT